jgi:hypothetical protein
MARAWCFQDSRQKAKLGAKAPWSVGWLTDGRRKSKRIGNKTEAKQYARRLEGRLAAGLHEDRPRVAWQEFRTRYEAEHLTRRRPATREGAAIVFRHFERIARTESFACCVGPFARPVDGN